MYIHTQDTQYMYIDIFKTRRTLSINCAAVQVNNMLKTRRKIYGKQKVEKRWPDGQRTKCVEQIFSRHNKESEGKKDLIKSLT